MLGEAIGSAIREINEIRERIENYKTDLSKNETPVRYSLIDPFLSLLGWGTANPNQVVPEYSTGSGGTDCALIDSESNLITFVGAKKLGTPEDLNQHITYCNSNNVSYFIVCKQRERWEERNGRKCSSRGQEFKKDEEASVQVCQSMISTDKKGVRNEKL